MDFSFPQIDFSNVKIQAALVSATVAIALSFLTPTIRHWFEKKFLIYKLNREYDHERQKEIKNLIGKMLGSLIDSGQNLNFRFFNLYENHHKNWLKYDGEYENTSYYIESMVFRFMRFMYHAKNFEDQELYIDSRKAEKSDQLFVYFIRSFFWVMTDIALFKNIEYDYSKVMDHFYADEMKAICSACDKEGDFPNFDTFRSETIKGERLVNILVFFDDLKPDTERYRWDRMVCFHLLLMSFLNAFGNKAQHSSTEVFEMVSNQLANKEIVINLLDWLHKLGLGEYKELNDMQSALTRKKLRMESA